MSAGSPSAAQTASSVRLRGLDCEGLGTAIPSPKRARRWPVTRVALGPPHASAILGSGTRRRDRGEATRIRHVALIQRGTRRAFCEPNAERWEPCPFREPQADTGHVSCAASATRSTAQLHRQGRPGERMPGAGYQAQARPAAPCGACPEPRAALRARVRAHLPSTAAPARRSRSPR